VCISLCTTVIHSSDNLFSYPADSQTLPAGVDGNARSLSKKVVKCVVDRSAEGRKTEHASRGVGRAGNGKDIPCLAKVSSLSD